MSHQTGIKANEKLTNIFSKAKNGRLRVIKVSIENEELTCSGTAEVKRDWESDYDKLVAPLLEENTPCYILYRLDSRTPLGYAWLLLSWVPDSATIRQKMVYASTKATLKTEFGSAHITEEQHATAMDETTLAGYQRHKRDFAAPAPLTMREEELTELRKTEVNTEISTDSRYKALGGITCLLTPLTVAAVQEMLCGTYNYLQFYIDLKTERIHISESSVVSLDQLPKQVPNNCPRYHLYLFKHTHDGGNIESFIFIYSMPECSCSVREKMIYSSFKASLLENLHSLGVEVAKKLEIDSGSELTEEYLKDALHPKSTQHRLAFAKPKGPANRGAKRLTRNQD